MRPWTLGALLLLMPTLAQAQTAPAPLEQVQQQLAACRAELVVVRSSRDQFERLVAEQMAARPPAPAAETAPAEGQTAAPEPGEKGKGKKR